MLHDPFPQVLRLWNPQPAEKVAQSLCILFGNISGFEVYASPKGHETAQAEAEEHHLRATKWVWQQQSPTGMGCGGPDAEDAPLLYWLQSLRQASTAQGAKLQPQGTPAFPGVCLVVSIKMYNKTLLFNETDPVPNRDGPSSPETHGPHLASFTQVTCLTPGGRSLRPSTLHPSQWPLSADNSTPVTENVIAHGKEPCK